MSDLQFSWRLLLLLLPVVSVDWSAVGKAERARGRSQGGDSAVRTAGTMAH